MNYIAVRGNVLHTKTQINLSIIILSEKDKSQRTTYSHVSLNDGDTV